MTKYSLLTGSTGLVGRYLMRDMLLNGQRLALIVRPNKRETAAERIEAICQFWEAEIGKPLSRPVVLSGNITDPGVVSEEDRKWIAEHCHRMIHSAAILEFFGKDREREPWRTNLNGTRNILELCRETGLRDMHYISTAYVAGLQDERVMEEQLDNGQEFRNDYEESKFEAEKLVREAEFLDPPTVYRPAVIAGDYNTGYTNTYHGIYLYLRLLAMMVPELPVDEQGRRLTPIKLNMTGREKRNIIPVDWVSAATSRLLEMPEAKGKTFHLAPKEPMTAKEIIEWCAEYFNTVGYEYCGDDPDFDASSSQEEDFAAMLIPNLATYQAYERTDNTYDLTNLEAFLPDLPAPKIDKTTLHRFIEFGENDKWGKGRSPKAVVAFDVSSYLKQNASEPAADGTQIGLDISGPGGGQFSVIVAGGKFGSAERGLPIDDNTPVLHMQVDNFAAMSAGAGADSSESWHGEPADELVEQASQALFAQSLTAADKQG